jgi:hypothetical protein
MDDPIAPQRQSGPKKSRRFLLGVFLFLMLAVVSTVGACAWYFWSHPCEVDTVRDASALLVTKRNTYDDAYQFATTVSRASLEHPVNSLKMIFMDTQDMDVPACMQTAKNELIDYMRTVNRAFDAYRAGESDPAVRELINQAETHYDNFAVELKAVNRCAPLCIPYLSTARLRR